MSEDLKQERESLRLNINDMNALDAIRNTRGYGVIMNVLKEAYMGNLKILAEGESAEARATLKIIDRLTTTIENKFRMGIDSIEELKAEKFKAIEATP